MQQQPSDRISVVLSHGSTDHGTWQGAIRAPKSAQAQGNGMDAMGKPRVEYDFKDVVFPLRLMADGAHVKMCMGDTRVANHGTPRHNEIRLMLSAPARPPFPTRPPKDASRTGAWSWASRDRPLHSDR